MSEPRYTGPERRATPRRRADDWKVESPVKLRNLVFKDMAIKLSYDPGDVMSIRMNPREAIVTVRGADGLPRSIRHELVDE